MVRSIKDIDLKPVDSLGRKEEVLSFNDELPCILDTSVAALAYYVLSSSRALHSNSRPQSCIFLTIVKSASFRIFMDRVFK
jgi:hypothetical protein